MERLTPEVRDLLARARLKIEALETQNAALRDENRRLRSGQAMSRGVWKYRDENVRQAARRRAWRESKRRAKLKAAA